MSEPMTIDTSAIPAAKRDAFGRFVETLITLFGDDLTGLSGFGGWVVDDPLYRETPARSVAVLENVDLSVLDRLASDGAQFGKRGIAAPLIMTVDYIRASCDVFPLELLEIQQLHARVLGDDHFADLKFEPRDLRLQCERELKSELIQLRQGLLRAAGKRNVLRELCLNCAERTVRILRGVMHIRGDGEVQQLAANIVGRATDVSGVALRALREVVETAGDVDFARFASFYDEIEALAAHVDQMKDA